MKRLLHETRGNASLWTAFAAAVLFVLAVAVYIGATLYSTYQTAQTELERAANVSVDASLVNANVRDLVLDIPANAAEQKVSDNLVLAGLVKDAGGSWERMESGKTRYCLNNMQITVFGEVLDIAATLDMPLPWGIGSLSVVELPIHIESRVLYLN